MCKTREVGGADKKQRDKNFINCCDNSDEE